MDLPEPDSPTRAKVWPRRRVKLASSTARRRPGAVPGAGEPELLDEVACFAQGSRRVGFRLGGRGAGWGGGRTWSTGRARGVGQTRGAGQQMPGVRVLWVGQDVTGAARLDDPALGHDHEALDPVGGDPEVVGHQQDRGSRLLADRQGSRETGAQRQPEIRRRRARRHRLPNRGRRWEGPAGPTETAGRALEVDVTPAREPGEHGGADEADAEITTVPHTGPPRFRPRSRGHAFAEIVGDPAGLSPGAPHRGGGLPVSEPGLDADTQCRSWSYAGLLSYVNAAIRRAARAVGPAAGPVQEPPRSRGIFRPASMATGSRFSAGGSGQVARSV